MIEFDVFPLQFGVQFFPSIQISNENEYNDENVTIS